VAYFGDDAGVTVWQMYRAHEVLGARGSREGVVPGNAPSRMRQLVDGEYIEAIGPASEAEMRQALVEVLGPVSMTHDSETFPSITLDDRTIVFIDFESALSRRGVIAIGDLYDDDEARRVVAKSIYQGLATATPWRLCWTSDDLTGVVATGESP
jgi:hypothetical protein